MYEKKAEELEFRLGVKSERAEDKLNFGLVCGDSVQWRIVHRSLKMACFERCRGKSAFASP